jgi:CO/xanthine dehydrogenase FAD-binding subunit
MRPFAYAAPASVDEAVALLADGGARARPLAGGTDILVQLRQGRFDLDLLVDVKRIPELRQVMYDAGTGLRVGAAVTCAELTDHPQVREHYPGLVDATSIIGGIAIQGRATLGGNLCNAAPSGDAISAMVVLGAHAVVAGPEGQRQVPVASFCTAPGKTVLGLGEVVVALTFPVPQPHSGAAYLRFIPRGEMDIAVAGAGAWIRLTEDHSSIADARIALAAVAPTPLLVTKACVTLIDAQPTEAVFAEAAALAMDAARPIEDTRGTIAQRRHLVGELVKRALRKAMARAGNDGCCGEEV